MRYLAILLILFSGLFCAAQLPTGVPYKNSVYYNKYVYYTMFDSGIFIPNRDTVWTPARDGALTQFGTSVYIYFSNKWNNIVTQTTPQYWTLVNGRLYPTTLADSVGIGKIPVHKFDVLDGVSSLYFDKGTLHLEDNPDSSNILINTTGTGTGMNNIYIGTSVGGAATGSFNTVVGRKALRLGVGVSYNAAFGQAALSEAKTNYSTALGTRSNQYGQRDSVVSVGFGANQNSFGGGNTAVGTNAQTASVIYSGTIKPSEITQGGTTFTGTNTATYISGAGLSVGDTIIVSVLFKTAPAAQTNPFGSLVKVTATNTLTFLNQSNFPSGSYDTATVSEYGKQSHSIALGIGASTTNSNQLAISPFIDTIKVSMATGVDYVLKDVTGNGKLTLNPVADLSGSATLDFPSTTSTTVSDLTITVTGAAVGDVVMLGIPNSAMTTTGNYIAWVSSSNTVSIRFSPKATENPSSATFKVKILK